MSVSGTRVATSGALCGFSKLLEASPSVGKSRTRGISRISRDRFDLGNKNNIQLKGNNTFGLIFIVAILYAEPFGQFSLRKFLSYSFYIAVSWYCIKCECVCAFSSQGNVAAAADDAAAMRVSHIASSISYSLCHSELVYCLLQHTALYIMTKSQYYSLQIIEFVYL